LSIGKRSINGFMQIFQVDLIADAECGSLIRRAASHRIWLGDGITYEDLIMDIAAWRRP
jgi:hypothetical protein